MHVYVCVCMCVYECVCVYAHEYKEMEDSCKNYYFSNCKQLVYPTLVTSIDSKSSLSSCGCVCKGGSGSER